MMRTIDNPYLQKIRELYLEIDKAEKELNKELLTKLRAELREQENKSREHTQKLLSELSHHTYTAQAKVEEIKKEYPSIRQQHKEIVKLHREVMELAKELSKLRNELYQEINLNKKTREKNANPTTDESSKTYATDSVEQERTADNQP